MLQNKFIMQLLAKLLDGTKAKNPITWFIVACLVGAIQVVISNAPEWKIDINPLWLNALQTIVTIGSLLLGSRTTQILTSVNSKQAELPPLETPSENMPLDSALDGLQTPHINKDFPLLDMEDPMRTAKKRGRPLKNF
jgi:hypothetical protein